jgi:hypothetical protein
MLKFSELDAGDRRWFRFCSPCGRGSCKTYRVQADAVSRICILLSFLISFYLLLAGSHRLPGGGHSRGDEDRDGDSVRVLLRSMASARLSLSKLWPTRMLGDTRKIRITTQTRVEFSTRSSTQLGRKETVMPSASSSSPKKVWIRLHVPLRPLL